MTEKNTNNLANHDFLFGDKKNFIPAFTNLLSLVAAVTSALNLSRQYAGVFSPVPLIGICFSLPSSYNAGKVHKPQIHGIHTPLPGRLADLKRTTKTIALKGSFPSRTNFSAHIKTGLF